MPAWPVVAWPVVAWPVVAWPVVAWPVVGLAVVAACLGVLAVAYLVAYLAPTADLLLQASATKRWGPVRLDFLIVQHRVC